MVKLKEKIGCLLLVCLLVASVFVGNVSGEKNSGSIKDSNIESKSSSEVNHLDNKDTQNLDKLSEKNSVDASLTRTPEEVASWQSAFVFANIEDTYENVSLNVETTIETTMSIKNQPPIPIISSPADDATFFTTSLIHFDGSNSTDLDNDTLGFFWTSNATVVPAIGTTASFSRCLPVGVHLITLYINDFHGANVSTTVNITVITANNPPTPVISSPQNGDMYNTTDSIYFDGANSTDPDEDTLIYYWTSNVTIVEKIGGTAQFTRNLIEGYHLITLYVNDLHGHNVSTAVNITVSGTEDTGDNFSMAGEVYNGTIWSEYLDAITDVNDYFKINLTAGQTLIANMTVPSACDFDLYLYNTTQELIDSSITVGLGGYEEVSTIAVQEDYYYIRAKAPLGGGGGTYTLEFKIIENIPPTPVTLNTPTNITTTSLDLSWSQGTDIDFAKYEIYQSTTSGIIGILIHTITTKITTSYNVGGLTPSTTYYFTIRVIDLGNLYADSNQVSGTTSTENLPPVAVILNNPVDPTTTSLSLSWSQNMDEDFAQYEIYMSNTGGFTPSPSTLLTVISTNSTTTYTVNELTQNTEYYFVVRINDTGGRSSDSNEVVGATEYDGDSENDFSTATNASGRKAWSEFITGGGGTDHEDYFKVYLTAGETLSVYMIVPSNRNFHLYLYNTTEDEVNSSTNSGDEDENASWAATISGYYYVRVYAVSGLLNYGVYSLYFTITNGGKKLTSQKKSMTMGHDKTVRPRSTFTHSYNILMTPISSGWYVTAIPGLPNTTINLTHLTISVTSRVNYTLYINGSYADNGSYEVVARDPTNRSPIIYVSDYNVLNDTTILTETLGLGPKGWTVNASEPFKTLIIAMDSKGVDLENISFYYKVGEGSWGSANVSEEAEIMNTLGAAVDNLNSVIQTINENNISDEEQRLQSIILPIMVGNAVIPAQSAGTYVEFYVNVSDSECNNGSSLMGFYYVDNPVGDTKILSIDPNLYCWVMQENVERLVQQGQEHSDYNLPENFTNNFTKAKGIGEVIRKYGITPFRRWEYLGENYDLYIAKADEKIPELLESYQPDVIFLSNVWNGFRQMDSQESGFWNWDLHDLGVDDDIINYTKNKHAGLIATHGTLSDWIIWSNPSEKYKVCTRGHVGDGMDDIDIEEKTIAHMLGLPTLAIYEEIRDAVANSLCANPPTVPLGLLVGSTPLQVPYVPFNGTMEKTLEANYSGWNISDEFYIEIPGYYEEINFTEKNLTAHTQIGWQLGMPRALAYAAWWKAQELKPYAQQLYSNLSQLIQNITNNTVGNSSIMENLTDTLNWALNKTYQALISANITGESFNIIQLPLNFSEMNETIEENVTRVVNRTITWVGEAYQAILRYMPVRLMALSKDGLAGIITHDKYWDNETGYRSVYFSFEVETVEGDTGKDLLMQAVNWSKDWKYNNTTELLGGLVRVKKDTAWKFEENITASSGTWLQNESLILNEEGNATVEMNLQNGSISTIIIAHPTTDNITVQILSGDAEIIENYTESYVTKIEVKSNITGKITIGFTANSDASLNPAYLSVKTLAVTTGSISGTVYESDGVTPVEGATVTVVATSYSDTTSSDGTYLITDVPEGTYAVTAGKTGYESDTVTNVVVTAGQTTPNVDFALTPEAVGELSVILNSPNGGEIWAGNTTHYINYTVGGGTPPYTVDLYYGWPGASIPIVNIIYVTAGTHIFEWTTPPTFDCDVVRVKVNVTDNESAEASDISDDFFTIDSTLPTIVSTMPEDNNISVEITDSVTIIFSEPMNQTPTQSAFSISPDPFGWSWSWNDARDAMTGTHNDFEFDTAYTVTITTAAKDLAGNYLAEAYSWCFTVSEEVVENHAPIVNSITANLTTVTEGGTVTITVDATDEDGDVLTYHYDYPGGTISGTGLTVTWTAPNKAGIYTITVYVNDGMVNSNTKSIAITVIHVNDPPIISGVPDQFGVEDAAWTLDVTPHIKDIDNTTEELTVTVNSSYVTVDGKVLTFLYPNGIITDSVKITVSDGIATVNQTITVTIIPVNDAPTISGIPAQYATEDTDLYLNVSSYVSDVDNSSDELTISTNSTYAIIDGFIITFTYPNGVLSENVRITVSDGINSSYQDIMVMVTPVNDAPVINSFSPIDNPTIDEGKAQTFTVSVSDIDSTDLVITWYLDGSSVATGNTYTFTSDYISAGTHTVKVVVSDGSLTDEKTWALTVNNVEKEEPKGFIPAFETAAFLVAMIGVYAILLRKRKY